MRILNFLTLSCSLFLLLYSGACFSQKIVSGPIQGHTTDTSAVFWVLTKNNLSFNIKENFSSPSYNVVIKEDTMCSAHLKNKKAYKYTLYFPTFKTPYAAQGKHSFYNYSVFLNGVKYNDPKAWELVDRLSEAFQYYLLRTSCNLAEEKGKCEKFDRTK